LPSLDILVGADEVVEDQFWGDRFGVVADPFGHQWQIATLKEDLTPEEIMERGKTAMAAMS
jgi:PhnB protein